MAFFVVFCCFLFYGRAAAQGMAAAGEGPGLNMPLSLRYRQELNNHLWQFDAGRVVALGRHWEWSFQEQFRTSMLRLGGSEDKWKDDHSFSTALGFLLLPSLRVQTLFRSLSFFDRQTGLNNDVRSNATSIDGGANAPTVSDRHGTVKRAISNDPSLCDYNWDDFLKLSDYLGHAVLYDGKTDLASYPDNTILYVNGNLSINTATPLKLCIIATGDISVSAQCNLQQPGTYPTLISENGDIDFGGGANVEGLVAAMGVASTISSSGGGNIPVNINGSIVLGGEFNGSGNWCINFKKVTLIPPGEDNTLVMAWQ
ncbi:MAG: hypothetical protein BWY83_01206 [bacterium ADurb.Bin478]|nr:MAG: hypothetical protein BWY83_01206 [bacterium ADurb.Bin478]